MARLDMAKHHQLMRLLCKAAGVEDHKVRRIECTCEAGEQARFNVDFCGKPEDIAKAIPDEPQPSYKRMIYTGPHLHAAKKCLYANNPAAALSWIARDMGESHPDVRINPDPSTLKLHGRSEGIEIELL